MDTRVLCLLLLSLSGWVTSSNVDTTGAIWFRGDERSYFGYSVNLYRYRNNPSMRYVLIGAPRANSSSILFQTGNTFRCDVLDPLSCTQLNLPDLDTANAISDDTETDGGDIEDKANMWMGGTVTSSYSTGVVVTSGHRYFRVGSRVHDPIGLAYVLPDPLGTGVKLSPCGGDNCDTRISRYGYCMSGFSSLILSDGSQLYIGAVGYNAFTGSIFRGFQSTDCNEGIFRQPVGFFGYMAYSLTSGRILDSNIETVVASGPRQNSHLGNVFLFNNNTDFNLNFVLSLHGTTQDSYYGFSLLAVDLNGDGMDELLVSAPMYSLPGSPEIGQVLVYPNVGTGLGIARTYIQQIPYARFGTAITDLGDLNKDGYPEIAISAPYGQQAGSVFIYSGTPQGSLTTLPIQTIRGEDVGLEIGAAFGASVSGKQDIDDNGYNDILVGAYVSSSAFLLRTLPIVSVAITPSNTPMFPSLSIPVARGLGFTENITLVSTSEQEYIFFTLQFLLSYSSLGQSPSSIRIDLTITSDPERLTSRVFFLEGVDTPIRTYQTEVTLEQDVELPMSMPVYIIDLDTQAYIFDFSFSVANPPLLDFNSSVVLANPGSVPRFSVQPDLDCGNDSECIPDLYITAVAVFPAKGTDPNDRYTEIIAGQVNEFSIDVTVGNRGENSFGTEMILTIPPGASYRLASIDNADLVIGCQNRQSSNGFTTLSCSPLGRPLGNNQVVQFSIVLGTETVSGNEGTLLVQMNLLNNNPDANNNLADNSFNVSVPVTAVADISVSVEVRPDRLAFNETTELRIQDLVDDVNNEFYTLSNLGPEITYTFTVRNAGPSPILNSYVSIDWPLGIQNSVDKEDLSLRDYFLYITDIDSNIVLCDTTYVNIRNLRTSIIIIDEGENPDTQGRKKRDKSRRRRQTNEDPDGFNTEINQQSNGESYIKIVCNIGTFPGSSEYELQVTAQVFEPTLVSRSAFSTWTFDVAVTAGISDTHVTQPAGHVADNSNIIVTLVPSSVFVAVEGFTLWWVIVVSVGLFIALLLPLFLILYFAGFFKKDKAQRAKNDEESRRLQLWNDNQRKGGDKPF